MDAQTRELLDKRARLRENYLQLDQELNALRCQFLSAKAAEKRALADKGACLHEKIVQYEQDFRVLRGELLAIGRADLAAACLVTPIQLRDLAGFFFRGEPLISFLRSSGHGVPPSAQEFPARFTLEHCEGEEGLLWRDKVSGQVKRATEARLTEQFWVQFTELLSGGLIKKMRSSFRERSRATPQKARPQNLAGRQSDVAAEMREYIMEMARAYPLEEWMGLFADAALAGQPEFVRDIAARHCGPPSVVKWAGFRSMFFWRSFEPIGLADRVPGLKHWADKAAWQFNNFISGDEKLKLETYKKQKSRHGLHREEPTLVSQAIYVCSGKIHVLSCER